MQRSGGRTTAAGFSQSVSESQTSDQKASESRHTEIMCEVHKINSLQTHKADYASMMPFDSMRHELQSHGLCYKQKQYYIKIYGN